MSLPAAIALCSNLARSLVVAASKNSVSSGFLSAASRFVVQRDMPCALASCASLPSLRPTRIGSGGAQRHAPLRADRQNGADEMLVHPHAAGHAVHDDAETLLRHADTFQMPDVRCQRSDKRATDSDS